MSNWDFLDDHRIREGVYASTSADGFNGAFEFALPGEARRIFCIASDGFGWQHVSISFGRNHSTPSWTLMDRIKNLFWDEKDWVVQFHPPKECHVNNHPGCLHLWRCTKQEMPVPESYLVGIRGMAPGQTIPALKALGMEGLRGMAGAPQEEGAVPPSTKPMASAEPEESLPDPADPIAH